MTVPVAATKYTNASHDYAELRQEAVRLARRILTELDSDTEPSVDDINGRAVNWGHVEEMAETRKELRRINDRMFYEGEYAPDAR